MDGAGKEGVYLGVDCPYEDARIVMVPLPYDATTSYQSGTDRGPQALIEASRNLELFDLETKTEPLALGIYTNAPIASYSSIQGVAEKLLADDKFVFGLGGEHSVSFPLVAAHAKKYPGLSVLQFDAHGDMRESYEGNPLSHASVMARIQDIPEIGPIASLGLRAVDASEMPRIKKTKAIFAHEIEGDWLEQILSHLGDTVYITFDLDAFDSSIMPSTGTPEPGGIDWKMATMVLRAVAEKKKIVGCDIVELMPIEGFCAPNFLAAKLAYKMITYTFQRSLFDGHCRFHEKTLSPL